MRLCDRMRQEVNCAKSHQRTISEGRFNSPQHQQVDVIYDLLSFPCREKDTATGFPNYNRPFVGEEVTVHNTGISLLLSTSVWVLSSPPIERRETRPTTRPGIEPGTVWLAVKDLTHCVILLLSTSVWSPGRMLKRLDQWLNIPVQGQCGKKRSPRTFNPQPGRELNLGPFSQFL